MTRKLATIRKINDIFDIPNADNIKLALVDGWKTIIKKDVFNVGDFGIYFEIDSLLPLDDERYSFINNTKKMYCEKYRYIKTIRLRGEISQGLLMPLSDFPEILKVINGEPEKFIDVDFSEQLNVVKYEEMEDIPMNMDMLGTYPHYIKKTGEKRIQNVWDTYKEKYKDVEFTPTLKMDGSSTTVAFVSNPIYFVGREDYKKNLTEQCWVGSHHRVLKDPVVDEYGVLKTNGFHEAVKKVNLKEKVTKWCKENNKQIAIQGELLGPKICGNFEQFKNFDFRAFYVYFIDENRRAKPNEFKNICDELDIPMVREYEPIKVFQEFDKLEDLLAFAEGDSENHSLREGLVFKSNDLDMGEPITFKVISNKYLLKKK